MMLRFFFSDVVFHRLSLYSPGLRLVTSWQAAFTKESRCGLRLAGVLNFLTRGVEAFSLDT